MNISAVENTDGTFDLVGKQGSTWIFNIVVFTDVAKTMIMDLTGYSARGHIRQTYNDVVPAGVFVCSITNPTTGYISVRMEASETAAIVYTKKKYYYDIEIYIGDPEVVSRVMEGKLTLDPEVTK